jgi:hypothetical protein
MKMRSFLGQELDIGSNKTHFWFWSRKMEPPALHYADHKDLYKTRLKTPLHPVWLMGVLGVGEVQGNWFYGVSDNLLVLEAYRSPLNEAIIKGTLIDSEKSVILGHYLFGRDWQVMASVEVREFYSISGHLIPKKVHILWPKENIQMIWELENVKINTVIDPENWEMPNMRDKIDMGSLP